MIAIPLAYYLDSSEPSRLSVACLLSVVFVFLHMHVIQLRWDSPCIYTTIFVKTAFIHAAFKLITIGLVSVGIKAGNVIVFISSMVGLMFSVQTDIYKMAVLLGGSFAWQLVTISIIGCMTSTSLGFTTGIMIYKFGWIIGCILGLVIDTGMIGFCLLALVKWASTNPHLTLLLFATLSILIAVSLLYFAVVIPNRRKAIVVAAAPLHPSDASVIVVV
jgi:hypothetical protein